MFRFSERAELSERSPDKCEMTPGFRLRLTVINLPLICTALKVSLGKVDGLPNFESTCRLPGVVGDMSPSVAYFVIS